MERNTLLKDIGIGGCEVIELKVNACANGVLAKASLDISTDELVIFSKGGQALGYIDLNNAIKQPQQYTLAEQALKKLAKKEFRPCLANGKKAFFHRWIECSDVVPPSPMVGGAPGGVIKSTFAIVEFEDGTINRCYPEEIKFLDRKEDENE